MGSLLAAILLLHAAEGPAEFLRDLCDNRSGPDGALFWSQGHVPPEGGAPWSPDSLGPLLAELGDLSVEPGDRTRFEETGEGYIIEYAGSVWSWTGDDGRLEREEGLTRILWRDGGYFWMEVPVLSLEASGMGLRERLTAGFLLTGMILGGGVAAMIIARRRAPSQG